MTEKKYEDYLIRNKILRTDEEILNVKIDDTALVISIERHGNTISVFFYENGDYISQHDYHLDKAN